MDQVSEDHGRTGPDHALQPPADDGDPVGPHAYLRDMLNTKVISLDEAPDAYATFDTGVSDKFIIDPHGLVAA